MTERQPFHARCNGCGHVWPAAYAPLPLAQFAKLLKAAWCPMGCEAKVYVDDGRG